MFNVTGADDNSTETVDFYYDEGNGWEVLATGISSDSGPYWTTEGIDGDLGSVENLDLKANFSGKEYDYSATTQVNLDQGGPNTFSLNTPGDYATSTDPTVEVKVTDDYSGVQNISVTVEDSNNDEQGSSECSNTTTCEVNPSDLSDGETYDVEVSAYDKVGNTETSSLSFTVDTEFDGDTNPSISVEDEDNGVVNFDSDKDMDVDFDSADSESDTTATCIVEGEDVGSTTFSSADSGTDELTCNIDLDEDMDYYDTEAEVYVDLEDEAGNTDSSDSETIAFDVNAPYVSMDSVAGVSTFNNNFDMELDVSDSATSAEYIEYFFDDSGIDYEDGTDISDFEDGEFEVDASDLDSGDHTLYVRAEDEAGHWSDAKSFDFEYLPDQDPEISLSVPENVSIEAGSSDSFEVEIENTGEFFIEELPVDVSSDVYSDSDSVAEFEPGASVTLSFDVEPAEEDLGKYDMEVSTSNPSASGTFNYIVRANEQQREDIQSRLDEQVERLGSVEENVTELQEKVSGEREERLTSNFSKFKSDVEDAQEAIENGDYYRAEALMEGIDEDYTAAQNAYDDVKKEYKSSQRFKLILGFIGLILVVGIGGIGFLVYEGRIDPEELKAELHDMTGGIGIDTGSIGGANIVTNIKSIFDGSDSEAEEFEWEGFKD